MDIVQKIFAVGIVAFWTLWATILIMSVCVNIYWTGTQVNTIEGEGIVISANWRVFVPDTLNVRLTGDGDNRHRDFLTSEVESL